ncbi:TfoX/Sxy family protein [Pigmentiphaga aceris]
MHEELRDIPDVSEKGMFGCWVWLVGGNLLCGAREDAMLVRLSKDDDAWALKMAGVTPMMTGSRRMPGWVWADPRVYGNDAMRRKLLDAALRFVLSLPRK